ncbi:hypothetical protein BU23DRAFT_660026 [Bimuria novae-zelandiae CBS 107.79]|uniref:Uncharacterized protein n=1 Tax=Bimuria novae-zelandiae CBS 107.79 TaxID=1447943 RepID=A0A6A5VKV9_9PLEO|nr:hypothetical protein BU23DRAFT_660026 [Bimuria novae-zelandiae CBS 107.79]
MGEAGFPKSIVVTILDRKRGGKLTADRVMVQMQYRKDSVPLKEAILSWTSSNGIRVDTKAQQLWWVKIDKPFRLMDLPLELRRLVYIAILGSQIRPHTVHDNTVTGSKVVLSSKDSNHVYRKAVGGAYNDNVEYRFGCRIDWKKLDKLPVPNYTIYRVNKQVQLEAFDATWTDTEKFFYDTSTFEAEWFKESAILQNMANWPCYMAVIDWILTAAFPYIKDAKNVRLRSAIKSATKRKWDYILHNESLLSRGKGVAGYTPFDYDEAIRAITNEQVSATPPKCDCPKYCNPNSKLPGPDGKRIPWSAHNLARKWCTYFDRDNIFSLEAYWAEIKALKSSADEDEASKISQAAIGDEDVAGDEEADVATAEEVELSET